MIFHHQKQTKRKALVTISEGIFTKKALRRARKYIFINKNWMKKRMCWEVSISRLAEIEWGGRESGPLALRSGFSGHWAFVGLTGECCLAETVGQVLHLSYGWCYGSCGGGQMLSPSSYQWRQPFQPLEQVSNSSPTMLQTTVIDHLVHFLFFPAPPRDKQIMQRLTEHKTRAPNLYQNRNSILNARLAKLSTAILPGLWVLARLLKSSIATNTLIIDQLFTC